MILLLKWALLAAAAGLVSAQTRLNENLYLQPNRVTAAQFNSANRNSVLCARNCVSGDPPKTCYYRFTAEDYDTMGPACGNCPTNTTDCNAPQCVVADGNEKSIKTFNRMVPGPSIEVCLGDRIVVDVINNLAGTELTVHWHGVWQRGTQYMDGVPMVTQCPIHEGQTFRYDFIANNPGTHYYHSHTGTSKLDGLTGSLIIRNPTDSNRNTYTIDDPDHVINILDWMNTTAGSRFPGFDKIQPGQLPSTFLPQGQGPPKPGTSRLPPPPYREFWVQSGQRYRFRLIGAMCSVCGVEVRIENHSLLLISTDGGEINPVSVSSLILFSGERYDVVINANQSPGTYWMHFRGLGECSTPETQIYQLAVLRYVGTNQARPTAPGYRPTFSQGTVANPENATCGTNQGGVCVSQLQGSIPDSDNILNSTVDVNITLSFGFHIFTRGQDLFNNGQYKRYLEAPDRTLLTSWINGMSFVTTPAPILSQGQEVPSSVYCPINSRTGYPSCPANTTEDYCECAYVIRIPCGANVQLFITDTTPALDLHHPFHLHGYDFYMIAMDQYRSGETADSVNRRLLTENFRRTLLPAKKDTVAVPSNGWAAVRFRATNPGVWFLHCHFMYHLATGMAVVLQVGDASNWPPIPPGFPQCNNYKPDLFAQDYNYYNSWNRNTCPLSG